MACDCQRTESTQVSPVFQSDQAEGDDDEEYSLLMDMPSEQKRGVATECHCSDEGIGCGIPEELDKWDYLKDHGESKAYPWSDLWKHRERRISNQASCDTVEGFCFDW